MDKAMISKAIGQNQLTPITSPWMHQLLHDAELVEQLLEKYGSPINLHHIPSFQKNINAYQEVFEEFGIDGQIYFARKANKCQILVKSALDYGIGVDTASYTEMEQAIQLGGTGANVVSTAAVKNERLLQLAIKNGIPVIIDNLDELQLANQIAGELKEICTIGIRLSGFQIDDRKLYSRFGFDIEKDLYNLKLWFAEKPTFPNLKLTGFHFHLDGYSIEERGEAALQSLEVIREFRKQGQNIEFLDIGGGILLNYLESKEEWDVFQINLLDAVRKQSKPITFKNNGLGFEVSEDNRRIRGKLNTYPFYNEVNGKEFLSQVLSYKNKNGETVADLLKAANVQLRIEPGRSLLNQVGLTIAKVAHRKRDSQGNWLVGLEMNMSQLKSSSADFLLDPYVVYQNEPEESEDVDLYFTGAYCLEQDVLLKRKLTFPGLPSRGDFVVFVNTAGYMMHFYETEAHLFDLSQNLFIESDSEIDINAVSNDADLSTENSISRTERINQ